MSKRQIVGGMSDWSGVLKDFFRQIDDGSMTLEYVRACVEHRFPEPIASATDWQEKLQKQVSRILRSRLKMRIEIDPLPMEFTKENLVKGATFNFRPVYLPEMEISSSGIRIAGKEFRPKNWVLPRSWFDEHIEAKKIKAESRQVKAGWRLADFSIGVDYTDGTQVFPNDPLSPLITRLRQEGRVGKYDQTPPGSRFSIVPKDEWDKVVCPEFAKELGIQAEVVRLETYAEFNAIGNLYDANRGKFAMWEWFSDVFGDSSRLDGGSHRHGGLADVHCLSASYRLDDIAGRPLVSFVK